MTVRERVAEWLDIAEEDLQVARLCYKRSEIPVYRIHVPAGRGEGAESLYIS